MSSRVIYHVPCQIKQTLARLKMALVTQYLYKKTSTQFSSTAFVTLNNFTVVTTAPACECGLSRMLSDTEHRLAAKQTLDHQLVIDQDWSFQSLITGRISGSLNTKVHYLFINVWNATHLILLLPPCVRRFLYFPTLCMRALKDILQRSPCSRVFL